MIKYMKQMGIMLSAVLLAASVPAFSVPSYGGVGKDRDNVATGSEIAKPYDEEESPEDEESPTDEESLADEETGTGAEDGAKEQAENGS